MADSSIRNLWGFLDKKTVPAVSTISEDTRGGMPKAYIPQFLYKPPFGYPRYVDLVTVRRLAAMPFVEMCISTIVDEICAVPWDIVAKEGKEDSPTLEAHIEIVKNFYENPNTNKESFEEIRRKYIRDILEIDAGVINKIFNVGGQMVEMVARDGATFTKNPDEYGMFTDRKDLIPESLILQDNKQPTSEMGSIGFLTSTVAKEDAAYFQYGWISGARPVPFGKKEILWFERNPRTDNLYGRSPVQNLADTIQTLIYAIEHNLSYFNDNSIPQGVLGLEGSDAEEIASFKTQWEQQQKEKDSAGNWKKKFHNLPVVGKVPTFTPLQLSNADLELLEGQKWWAKMVWASFGVTSVELGYTEDSKGLANQIVQSNVFKKRSINPLLRIEEYKHNHEIISEFEFDDVEFKFLLFDVEEETKKAQLYQAQLSAGYKSVNEIRLAEGLDEVEWGDKQSPEEVHDQEMAKLEATQFNREGPLGKEEGDQKKKVEKEKEVLQGKKIDKKSKITADKESEIIKENKKKPEAFQRHKFKPAVWTHPNGHPRCLTCGDEERTGGYCDGIEKKGLHPLILGPNETMDEDRLKKGILYLLGSNEKLIKDLIEKEIGKDKLSEVKSVEDIAKLMKGLLSFEGIKAISDKIIGFEFVTGWDSSEKQIEKNIPFNNKALEFLQDHTFDNIKGMTEEITNDLKAELERGIINGEGVVKLKNRVEKVFNVGENRAAMIARTETNRAENQGRLLAMKGSGLDFKKKWSTHEDDRTSPICKRLDGQVVDLDDNFKDSVSGWEGQSPPSHVNCRSSVVYIEE